MHGKTLGHKRCAVMRSCALLVANFFFGLRIATMNMSIRSNHIFSSFIAALSLPVADAALHTARLLAFVSYLMIAVKEADNYFELQLAI